MAGAESWVNVEVGQVLAQTNHAEGDCLFEALSQQLEGQLTSLQLREMAITYLSEHRDQFEAELLSLGWDMVDSGEIAFRLEGDILIDAVLQTLSNPRTWGGAECLAALSLALNRGIRVYQEGGPTVDFPEGENPLLRVLLRYPRGGNRRTHYESVLHWRCGPRTGNQPTNNGPAENQQEASTQTCAMPLETSALSEETSAMPEGCNPTQGRPNPAPSAMVLRARASLPSTNFLREENFSDSEEFVPQPDHPNHSNLVRFRLCVICRHNVGKYVLLNCGAFPVCGACIRVWYVNIVDDLVPNVDREFAGGPRCIIKTR